MAEASWVGKAISIKCLEPSGSVFQGTIKEVSPEVITIVRAFRNGVPIRKPDTEVKIASANIMSLELIPDTPLSSGVVTKPTPIKHPNLLLQQPQQQQQDNNSFQQYKKTKAKNNPTNNQFKDHSSSVSPQQSMLYPIQPVTGQGNHNRTAQVTPNNNHNNNKKYYSNSGTYIAPIIPPQATVSSQTRPIDIPPVPGNSYMNSNNSNGQRTDNNGMSKSYQEMGNGTGNGRSNNNNNNGGGGNGNNGKNSRRYQNNKKETFGTPVNDPTMDEDFDFEKNLALFDKQGIFEKINQQMSSGKPDLLHHPSMSGGGGYSSRQPQPKYRHDENILASAPTQYRQIEVDYNSSRDYVTDEGLIVPSIPLIVRNRVQTAAEARGLTWERQIDILSRGACDTALQLLGGARRLKPNNQHQWPKIVIVCEEPYNERKSEIGICTGRVLATHGLKVVIYVKELTGLSRMSYELDLFKATGNEFTTDTSELPSCDLIIISARASHLSKDITKWVNESRSPVMAIDPPVNGFVNIQAKCSILPILPLDDINMTACGKLYLCSLGIPVKFFNDAGIKYNSPFGHKYVIPIHNCD